MYGLVCVYVCMYVCVCICVCVCVCVWEGGTVGEHFMKIGHRSSPTDNFPSQLMFICHAFLCKCTEPGILKVGKNIHPPQTFLSLNKVICCKLLASMLKRHACSLSQSLVTGQKIFDCRTAACCGMQVYKKINFFSKILVNEGDGQLSEFSIKTILPSVRDGQFLFNRITGLVQQF